MGLLDKQSRVIDFTLTERGRRLYAAGKLEFTYFGIFDDGIDYDPYSTGTLDNDAIELSIENELMHEVPVVPEQDNLLRALEPRHHVFTTAMNYTIVPSLSIDDEAFELECIQRLNRDGTYLRSPKNLVTISPSVDDEDPMNNEAYVVDLYLSGTNGLTSLGARDDLQFRLSYDPFISLSVDDRTVDRPINVVMETTKLGNRRS